MHSLQSSLGAHVSELKVAHEKVQAARVHSDMAAKQSEQPLLIEKGDLVRLELNILVSVSVENGL